MQIEIRLCSMFLSQEMVGPFHADFYQINGMVLESRKRREHLSEEDLQKNKAIMESLTKGSFQGFTNGEVSSMCVFATISQWQHCMFISLSV